MYLFVLCLICDLMSKSTIFRHGYFISSPCESEGKSEIIILARTFLIVNKLSFFLCCCTCCNNLSAQFPKRNISFTFGQYHNKTPSKFTLWTTDKSAPLPITASSAFFPEHYYIGMLSSPALPCSPHGIFFSI